MNIVRIPRLLKQTTLLLTVLGSSFLLSACGGDDDKGTSTASSSSSSVSSHTFSSTPVTPPFDGTWPKVKVSANHTKTLKFEWTSAPSNTTFYKLLKKANKNDITSEYEQVGLDFTATTVSDTISVHLIDWVNSLYKVQACDANAVCADSTEIIVDSAMLSAITYVKARNAEAGDWFGWSIAISGDGNTMAVGAPAEASKAKGVDGDEANNDSPTSGAVYVFAKVNGNWIQEAYLKASNTEQPGDGVTLPIPNANARFGYQVALNTDGNTLAVSAINEYSVSVGVNCEPHNIHYSSSAANSQGYVTRTTKTNIGAVYVFKRTNTLWNQTAYIKPLLAELDLEFGQSLALSGDGKTLAVGTAIESTYASGVINKAWDSNSSSSEAFECKNFSSSSSTSSSDSSTSSSSSSSSTSSLSSTSTSSSSLPGGLYSGAVYIYRLTDTSWSEEAYIKASDAGQEDRFGTSLSLSRDGNLLAVGAPGEDSKTTSADNDTLTVDGIEFPLNNGGVYLFSRDTNKWSQLTKLKPSPIQLEQAFGTSVALSADGTTLAIGSPGDWTATGGINVGAVYDPTDTSFFSSGAAFIFVKSESVWEQQAYIKPNVVKPLTQFGSTVSISANGGVLAVGSWIESSLATGINGDQIDASSLYSGAAYTFTRTGITWSQRSYIKAPNSNTQDRFGRALQLDGSGENLVIGAYRESSKASGINGDQTNPSSPQDPKASDASGAAYIYQRLTTGHKKAR